MASDSIRPTALITGATEGIGNQLVPFFAGTGHNVVLVARQKSVLEGIAAAVRHVFRVNASVIACDLDKPEAADSVFAELSRHNMDVDVLVNHVGLGTDAPLPEESSLRAKIGTLTALTKLLLPSMIARGEGKILNVASNAEFAPIPGHSFYSTVSASVVKISETLSHQLENTGITVTALCPEIAETSAENDRPEGTPGRQQPTAVAQSEEKSTLRALIRSERDSSSGWVSLAMPPLAVKCCS